MNSDWSVIWPGDGEDKTIALVKLFAMVTLSLKVTRYALRWLLGKVDPIVPFTSSPPPKQKYRSDFFFFLLQNTVFFSFFSHLPFDGHPGQPKRAERSWRSAAPRSPQLGDGWRQSAPTPPLQSVFFEPPEALTNQSGFPTTVKLLQTLTLCRTRVITGNCRQVGINYPLNLFNSKAAAVKQNMIKK